VNGPIEFEVRVPASTPVGDGDYEEPVTVSGYHGLQSPLARDALHHLIYVTIDESDECGSFSVHALSQDPTVDLRRGLREFAAALRPA
jgi:hypothetical protein